MARIVFLSDLHLSVWSRQAWPDTTCRERLRVFLAQLLNGRGPAKGVERIVLLGDIFDTWRCPVDVEPPAYEEILAAHADTMALFHSLAGTGRLTYVIGNHDFDVPVALIRQAMPGVRIIGPGVKEAFRIKSGRLYAQHGHQHSLFNRVSARAELLAGYPIGYYVTRLRASLQDGGGQFSFGQIQQYLGGLRAAVGGEGGVFRTFLDAVSGSSKAIRLRDGVTVSLLRIRDFAGRLGRKQRAIDTVWKAAGEATLLTAADQACLGERARWVVFGHTHRALLDEPAIFPLGLDRTYVNTGCWCAGQPHFAVFDTKEPGLDLFTFQGNGGWLPTRGPSPSRRSI
jgi:UDP-2,3-diacylglucosamine pyrophosphatase LpxH